MRTVQPKGPYFLCGYCFGGIVAFDMAQQLKKQNEEVALLAILLNKSFSENQKKIFRTQMLYIARSELG